MKRSAAVQVSCNNNRKQLRAENQLQRPVIMLNTIRLCLILSPVSAYILYTSIIAGTECKRKYSDLVGVPPRSRPTRSLDDSSPSRDGWFWPRRECNTSDISSHSRCCFGVQPHPSRRNYLQDQNPDCFAVVSAKTAGEKLLRCLRDIF